MQVNVAGIRRNIKNLAHNYSEAQIKVREATSNDPWGPSATIMAEIADLTYNIVAFSEIMQMIWKRLNDHGKNWRHVYKALILLEYLIKTGTEKVAQQCKENIYAIQTLREFVHYEEAKDQGIHVREKARHLVNLLKDDERLKTERGKALKAKERFSQHASGFGSDGYIEGPTHRDVPPGWQEEPPKMTDIEFVRPQTAGEEELQLQLAMAMSREEAEQEEAKRRSDDVRLQLALSQSEQDFKVQGVKKEPQNSSHLLDLLDISMGAASITSPHLEAGAAGGSADPWGTKISNQISDPWSGTTSPQNDPWHLSAKPVGALPTAPIVSMNNDAWLSQRNQSPSVTSGSSNEGWLQNSVATNNSNNMLNGNNINDPWLQKTTSETPQTDPWLEKDKSQDPWHQKSSDPWAPPNDEKRPSPVGALTSPSSADLDEFDIICNRNKTGNDFEMKSGLDNNNSLLEEMDPLSKKKPLKDPQAFLGENSALVNLDNLIKPINASSSAAYNPFSDNLTASAQKPNLFHQQAPTVPSINQLKQQQPFQVSLNQDPWAPLNSTNNSATNNNNNNNINTIPPCFKPESTASNPFLS